MSRTSSILAVDFGNVHTRAVLIDVVEGVYRLVSQAETRTTADFPFGDVSIGLRRAIQQISEVTGRSLITPGGEVITPEMPDRSGVDAFMATASTGRPLRTVVVGLVPEISVASGRRAAAGTYVEIVETLDLADRRAEEERLNAIVASRPDLIFITGGTENGAREPVLELARVAQLAVRLLQTGNKPAVLYAGNGALAPMMQALFGGLTTLFIAPNVRPSLSQEDLEGAQLQLALAFDARQANRGGGYQTVAQMARLGVLPTAQSYSLIVDYLGRSRAANVLAVDVGSATSTLAISLDQRLTTVIRTDIGVGHSAESLRHQVGEAAIERWLPFVPAHLQIQHYTLNKTLRPATIPETLTGVYLEHGLLRAGIQALVEAARPAWAAAMPMTPGLPQVELIIAAGAALTRTSHPGWTALLLLDALQPTGVNLLRADPHGLVAALGALAHVNPEAVVQVLDSSSLERIGAVFNLSGQPAAGRTAMTVKITTSDGELVRHEVAGGHIWVFPLPAGKTARVEIAAARGLNIGGRSRLRLTVEGGAAGLIFDARGRPLPLAASPQGRAAQLPQWVAEITGQPLRPVEQVAAVEEGAPAEPDRAAPPPRRRGRGRAETPPDATAEKAERPARRGWLRRGRGAVPAAGAAVADELEAETSEDDFFSELDELRR